MSGLRLDRFLASTAIVLLLSAAAGGAVAEPMTQQAIETAAPEPANAAPPAAPDLSGPAQKPTGSIGEPTNAAPAAAPPPAETPNLTATTEQPTNSAPAIAAPPAATPNTTATTEQPENATPAAAQTPAAAPAAAEPAQPTIAVPAATPAPSAVADADSAIADQLHELANGKFDHIIGGKKDRVTIDAFYSGRNYAPLWITGGKANDRAKAAIGYLGHVDADGLDPADYPVPNFAALSDPAALAEAEIKLSMSVITYAHHAQVGRVHWSRVSADIEYTTKAPEPADVLANMVEATDVAAALAAYEPQTAGYLALKAKLAEIRAGKTGAGKAPIPNGPAPKIGAQDDRVPQLRARLGMADDDGTIYDKALAEAVKKFQHEHELKATGTLTAATIEALNGRQPDHPLDIILANMERWRWMPHDLGNSYVIVNLPDYTLRVMHNGKQLWMTKIVDGKPGMPTPIMTGEMKFITINPTWNVPPSIVNNEYLPALQQDPTVLERMGLKVSHNPDGTIHISQPPGDKNALGHVRFNFPNKFLVYQHDTPDKYMFAYDKRAFSHGCMRVQDPAKYAEVLLSLVRPGEGYTADRIKKMFGTTESDIQFPTFIPVNLTYQTAFVDDAGKLEFREDIYGRDKALIALLKGDDRRVADIPIEHKESLAHRQVLAIPDQPSLWGGRTYSSAGDGQNFFSRLFGFGAQPAPVPRKPVQRRRESRSGTTVQR